VRKGPFPPDGDPIESVVKFLLRTCAGQRGGYLACEKEPPIAAFENHSFDWLPVSAVGG
jgi:hypothetical protein